MEDKIIADFRKKTDMNFHLLYGMTAREIGQMMSDDWEAHQTRTNIQYAIPDYLVMVQGDIFDFVKKYLKK